MASSYQLIRSEYAHITDASRRNQLIDLKCEVSDEIDFFSLELKDRADDLHKVADDLEAAEIQLRNLIRHAQGQIDLIRDARRRGV